MTTAEWVGLMALLMLQLALLAAVGSATALAAVGSAVVGAVLALLFVVMWELDRLRFQEDAWAWIPLASLFRNLGDELPYYPAPAIGAGRCRPSGRVRVASYPEPYPDMSGKVINVVDFGRRR
ncbi:MAG: hypothetical protein GY788_05560 [bacterium]|nr:hypothetical protein [bacterium]